MKKALINHVNRDFKTLYNKVLKFIQTKQAGDSGICTSILLTKNEGWITQSEYSKINADFMKRKPVGKSNSEYWFKDQEERINFLNAIILSY